MDYLYDPSSRETVAPDHKSRLRGQLSEDGKVAVLVINLVVVGVFYHSPDMVRN